MLQTDMCIVRFKEHNNGEKNKLNVLDKRKN